jgi:hypothetical protein
LTASRHVLCICSFKRERALLVHQFYKIETKQTTLNLRCFRSSPPRSFVVPNASSLFFQLQGNHISLVPRETDRTTAIARSASTPWIHQWRPVAHNKKFGTVVTTFSVCSIQTILEHAPTCMRSLLLSAWPSQLALVSDLLSSLEFHYISWLK